MPYATGMPCHLYLFLQSRGVRKYYEGTCSVSGIRHNRLAHQGATGQPVCRQRAILYHTCMIYSARSFEQRIWLIGFQVIPRSALFRAWYLHSKFIVPLLLLALHLCLFVHLKLLLQYSMIKADNLHFFFTVIFALGSCYEEGIGTRKDSKMTVCRYEQATKQKHPGAFRCLRDCNNFGRGVPRGTKKTKRYYGRAANSGNAVAQFIYASCLEKGTRISVNHGRAILWFQKAAMRGLLEARACLRCLLAGSLQDASHIEYGDVARDKYCIT